MPNALDKQELVVHLYAPLDGPQAAAALAQTRAIWHAGRSLLGMTQPIVATGLPSDLPLDPGAEPDGPVAAAEDQYARFQVVARREHDVLNLSVGMAAPQPHAGLTEVLPPGWYEFTRWWSGLTADGTDALLGEALVYLAESEAPVPAGPRAAVPPQADDGDRWWDRGMTLDGFACWEVTPRGFARARRIVLLARPDQAKEISGLAWSSGGAEMPPLGRYLMHAAKLRYLGRVHDGGREPARIRDRLTARLDRLDLLLSGQAPIEAVLDRFADAAALRGAVVADEAALNETLESLGHMRRSVDISRDNLTASVAGRNLPDAGYADQLARMIADDIDYLETTRERAERTRDLVPPVTPVSAPARSAFEHRICFGVDIVNYSGRSTPAQIVLQERLSAVFTAVLADLGIAVHDTDRQPAGDGLIAVLPPGLSAPEVMAGLLHGWRVHLAVDNGAHPEDHIRLRISIGTGPLTTAALGFGGRSIIEVGRLLDSESLRQAVRDRPDADVVALVSGRLYDDVVGEGHPGLDPAQFEQVSVLVKELQSYAWLWTGGAVNARGPR